MQTAARVASWQLRTLGNAGVALGALLLIGTVVGMVFDAAAFVALGGGVGLMVAGQVLRDAKALGDLETPRQG